MRVSIVQMGHGVKTVEMQKGDTIRDVADYIELPAGYGAFLNGKKVSLEEELPDTECQVTFTPKTEAGC